MRTECFGGNIQHACAEAYTSALALSWWCEGPGGCLRLHSAHRHPHPLPWSTDPQTPLKILLQTGGSGRGSTISKATHVPMRACVCVCSFMHACMFNKINYLRSYLPACLTTCQPATHLHTNFILTESLASIHFAMPSAVFLRKEGVSTKEGISLKAQTSS